MNRKQWQGPEGHPPAALLLLHREGEHEGRDAEPVRVHMSTCPQCQSTCEQLERGMSRFTAFRDSVVLPTPAPRTSELERLLRESDKQESKAGALGTLRKLLFGTSNRRLVFAMGAATCALFVGLVLFLSNPRQSVYASQILNDARSASNALMVQSKVLNQKFRLRRGSLVIERTAHHGRAVSVGTKEPPVDAQLQKSLDLARIRLTDPLSVNDFSDWRSEQNAHSDSVRETSQSLIITVHVSGSAVTAGSLTLSRSGLRPIARSVEFRGESPIEISEESYSISDFNPAPSASVKAPPATAAPESITPANATPEPSPLDLESSELDLREAFHAIGADVSASPQLWKADHTVLYYARPKNYSQREAMQNAAVRIPHVKEAEQAPVEAGEPEPVQAKGPYETTPPLADALRRSLGSEQAASTFLDLLRTKSLKVEAEGDALNDLGKRYSPEVVKGLPPALRKRVNTLASSLLSSLQHDAADFDKFLAPTLDAVSQGLNAPNPDANSDNLPGCLTWQQSAALAAPQLRDLRHDSLLMFEPQESGSPATPSAEELLADTIRIRSFLEAHLISTCELF